jgi:hypothetical protein
MEDIFQAGFNSGTNPSLENASAGFVGGATALAGVGAIGNGVGGGFVMNPMLPGGITDGSNTIQGVRSYDATIGTWTTPDAFGGKVGDPMSQKSYMWNRNDPELYNDPSGFVPTFSGPADPFGVAAAIGET